MDFNQTAEVLIAFPGNLVYHLVVTISAVLLFSLARLYAAPDGQTRSRWVLASSILLILQVVYLAIGAASQMLSGNLLAMLPSLDRYISLLAVGIFCWLFVFPHPSQRVNQILAISIGIGLLAVLSELLIAPDPRRADQAWTILGLLILIFILYRITTTRPDQWFIVQSGVVILLAGYFLHLTGRADPPALQGMVRWAELAAYPLFVLAAARAMAHETFSRAGTSQTFGLIAGQDDIIPEHRPENLLPTIGELLSSPKDEELAKNAVRTIAQILRAEMCLLLTPPDLNGQFAIGAGYDLIQEHHISGAPLEANDCPILAAALTRRKPVSLPAQSHAPDLQILKQALGIDATGPIMMVPMVARGHLEGGVLLLSPFARRRWHDEERKTLEQFAKHLAVRFRQLRNQTGLEPSITDENPAQVAVLEEEIDRLSEMLRVATGGKTGGPIGDNLTAVLEMHEEAQSTIQSLEAEIERLSRALFQRTGYDVAAELEQMANDLQESLQELTTTRAQLALAKQRLRRTQGFDTQLARGILDELHSPVANLQSQIHQLQQAAGRLEPAQVEALSRASAGVDRVEALTAQLSNLIVSQPIGTEMLEKSTDLLECIETALTQVGENLRQKRLTLRMDFPDWLPEVVGDKDNITQILTHLINNAILVSPEREELIINAEFQSDEAGEFVTCVITDNGPGIPAEDIPHVFDASQDTEEIPIAGIGESRANLSYAKTLTEAIGGRLWIESLPHLGCTFTILLQVADSSQSIQPRREEP